MPQLCIRCETYSVINSSGFCTNCQQTTATLVAVDTNRHLTAIRAQLFKVLKNRPVYRTYFDVLNVSFEVFDAVFANCNAKRVGQDRYTLDVNNPAGEEVISRRQVLLNSCPAIAAFAALHTLQGSTYQGGFQAARCLKKGGEVAVLVPPLTATWTREANFDRIKFHVSTCFLNAGGVVSPLALKPVFPAVSLFLFA